MNTHLGQDPAGLEAKTKAPPAARQTIASIRADRHPDPCGRLAACWTHFFCWMKITRDLGNYADARGIDNVQIAIEEG